MEKVGTADFITATADRDAGLRIAEIFGKGIYGSLLGLIALTAIPYGTNEYWWKALFICAVFGLGILAIIEAVSSRSWSSQGAWLLLPLLTVAAFSLLQTAPLGTHAVPGISFTSSDTISADPYASRFFTLQFLAITLVAALMFRYVSSERRIRILINVIIAVVAASAIFGMLRQTTQHDVGFVLPLLKPDQGYGQFINRNHFAYLMEMGFGLALGLIVGGGVKRERILTYFASLLPIWTALVLSNSRGGLLAMIAQLTVGALLFTLVVPAPSSHTSALRVLRAARSLTVRVLLLVVLLTGAVVGTVWVGGDRLVGRIEDAQGNHDTAGVSRNEIWRATWQMFKDHPIAGVGMGGYWIAIHEHHDASGVLAPQEAHNDYLELLASGGIIGAALGIWFFIVLVRRTRANLRSPNQFERAACFGATLGMVGVAFHSLFDFGLHMIANAFIFIALVIIATHRKLPDIVRRSSDA